MATRRFVPCPFAAVVRVAFAGPLHHIRGMLDTLRALFRPAPDRRTEVAADLAVAALMVDAARADGQFDLAERQAVTALLAAMFDLTPVAAAELAQRGEAAVVEAADLVRFTRVVKFGLDEEARIALMQGLWQIVLTDHHRDPHEDALLRRLAPLIAVSDHDSAAARRRALAAMPRP